MNVKKTTIYEVKNSFEQMKIYISETSQGQFIGGVLHLIHVNGQWAAEQIKNTKAELEQFFDITEEGVYQQCDNWVNNYLTGKGGYTIDKLS